MYDHWLYELLSLQLHVADSFYINNSLFVHTILRFEPLYIVTVGIYVAPQILFP